MAADRARDWLPLRYLQIHGTSLGRNGDSAVFWYSIADGRDGNKVSGVVAWDSTELF